MKANVITLLMLSALCLSAYAQDDDMYFMSSKKKAQKSTTSATMQSQSATSGDSYSNTHVDYHIGQLRDVDEYNRRYPIKDGSTASYHLEGDTLYVSTTPSQDDIASHNDGYYDGYSDGFNDGDFTYTSRLARYRGYRLDDPFYWDYYYSWYDPWYTWHSPYYYNYIGWNGWGLSWGWHYPYYHSGWNYGWNYGWGHHHHHGGQSGSLGT